MFPRQWQPAPTISAQYPESQVRLEEPPLAEGPARVAQAATVTLFALSASARSRIWLRKVAMSLGTNRAVKPRKMEPRIQAVTQMTRMAVCNEAPRAM